MTPVFLIRQLVRTKTIGFEARGGAHIALSCQVIN